MEQGLQKRIGLGLVMIRLSVFLVMLMWTLDKFLRVDHAKLIFSKFYYMSEISNSILQVVAILEIVLILAFLVGFKKRITYGAVFFIHAVSTFSSYKQYLAPFEGSNLLFFAAWPMLAACFILYMLRDHDTKGVLFR